MKLLCFLLLHHKWSDWHQTRKLPTKRFQRLERECVRCGKKQVRFGLWERADFIVGARDDLAFLLQAVEVMREALEFECGDRCARGINECSAREALTALEKLAGGE